MSVFGIILGILGLIGSIPLAFLAGVAGGAISALLGVIALILGIVSLKKKGKGVGSIVLGALAIIASVFMTVAAIGVMKNLQETARNTEGAELVAECLKDPNLGFLGALKNLPDDEAGLRELLDEIKALSDEE